MRLKVPPVALAITVAGVMWLLNLATRFYSFQYEWQEIASFILFLFFVGGIAASFYAFRKLKTTVDPMHPENATSLITIGIYHLTRNPMYLSMFLLLAAWAVRLGNPLNILLLAFFIWYMTSFQIKPEEEALKEKFGSAYDEYCKKVRRWI